MATQNTAPEALQPQLEDERPHAWSDAPDWQESVCAWFLDPATGVGGFLRWGVLTRCHCIVFIFEIACQISLTPRPVMAEHSSSSPV